MTANTISEPREYALRLNLDTFKSNSSFTILLVALALIGIAGIATAAFRVNGMSNIHQVSLISAGTFLCVITLIIKCLYDYHYRVENGVTQSFSCQGTAELDPSIFSDSAELDPSIGFATVSKVNERFASILDVAMGNPQELRDWQPGLKRFLNNFDRRYRTNLSWPKTIQSMTESFIKNVTMLDEHISVALGAHGSIGGVVCRVCKMPGMKKTLLLGWARLNIGTDTTIYMKKNNQLITCVSMNSLHLIDITGASQIIGVSSGLKQNMSQFQEIIMAQKSGAEIVQALKAKGEFVSSREKEPFDQSSIETMECIDSTIYKSIGFFILDLNSN